MKELTVTYLPWMLSAVTLYAYWLAHRNKKKGALILAASQIIWLAWVMSSKTYGFIPLVGANYLLYLNLYFKEA